MLHSFSFEGENYLFILTLANNDSNRPELALNVSGKWSIHFYTV